MNAQTKREKMTAGQLYRASGPGLVAARIRARRFVRVYNATDPEADEGRRALLTGLFEEIGDDAIVAPPFHCDRGWNISLGTGAYLNVNCVMLDCAPVTIGAHSLLGPGVQLCAATHPVDRVTGSGASSTLCLSSSAPTFGSRRTRHWSGRHDWRQQHHRGRQGCPE
jgi:maltose O-acetyltransferase